MKQFDESTWVIAKRLRKAIDQFYEGSLISTQAKPAPEKPSHL